MTNFETQLWKFVLKNTKTSYRAKRDKKGKLLHNIANYGLGKNGIAIREGKGEYTDFTIKVLEDVKPLLTESRISRAIKFISKNDIQSSIRLLNIDEEVNKYGIGILYEILKIWLDKNELPIPQEYINKSIPIVSGELKNWITKKRNEPIDIKFEIIGIGKSKKGNSVVPNDWTGRIFENGKMLHQEMNNLDWRKGKAPVHFCCIYSMTIKDIYNWSNKNDEQIKIFNPILAIELFPDENFDNLNCQVIDFYKKDLEYNIWLKNLPNKSYVLPANTNNNKIIIATFPNIILKKCNYEKTENVGILASRLQKSIRRGRKCSKLLYETMKKLAKSPYYNLPEQQYTRVSGCRQLVWRLFITIVEDVKPYKEDEKYLSILDIISLSILTHINPEIQFCDKLIDKIIFTGLLIQTNDNKNSNWNWRKGASKPPILLFGKPFGSLSNIINSFKLAIRCMPMMVNDKRMLIKSINYINYWYNNCNKLKIYSIDKMLSFNEDINYSSALFASNDMHCIPNILIKLQASLPFIPYDNKHTLKGLATFIWEHSSKINVRKKNTNAKKDNKIKIILNCLIDLQKNLNNNLNNNINYVNFINKNSKNILKKGRVANKLEARIGFLLLFGDKIRLPSDGKKRALDIIVAGNCDCPCKVRYPLQSKIKYLPGKERFMGELRYIKYMKKGITIKCPNPPIGFKWIWNDKKITINVILVNSNPKLFVNKLLFVVNGYMLNPFDATPILKPINRIKTNPIPNNIITLIKQALYLPTKYKYKRLNNILRNLNVLKRKYNDLEIYDWFPLAIKSKIPKKVWKNIVIKLCNGINNSIQVGPVDRRGNKLHESIDYLYEGTVLRMLHLLSILYPNVVKIKTDLKFIIIKDSPGYLHMKKILNKLMNCSNQLKTINIIKPIVIKTKLWDHQKITSNKITDGLINIGKRGYGDASNVGAGKTLSALVVMANILNNNLNNKKFNLSGFLVLLPSTKLYKTWEDEIKKHTNGFIINKQNANGTLTNNNIYMNTILITTLGRMRDHSIVKYWQLVIIDECLSIQNRDALQTQEAWRQIIQSQYGVIMMSATFFRSRFDKLFYMLKMLSSGLPEEKKYLDTILSECIVCYIPEKSRKWITNINKFKLNNNLRKAYDEIVKKDLDSEKLYIMLNKLLFDNFDYIICFKKIIKKLDINQKALIYSKSKTEANIIANEINGVTRYPNKSGKHVVLSYAEGTYGLNDLILYNCIITRPPDSDKLPQMKGRLDRNGQTTDILHIEYLLAKDTVEEAWLLKLEMANNFYKHHILPLAEFYDIAVGKINIPINK